jgi:hypothetical protein
MRYFLVVVLLLFVQPAFASGGFEDSLADFMSWVVLIVMPVGGIYLFWQAHIYPEKVAEENNHPQLKAIKIMCLLSLFVGGLLWPFALIWANYNYKEKTEDDLITSAVTGSKDDLKTDESPEVVSSNPSKTV